MLGIVVRAFRRSRATAERLDHGPDPRSCRRLPAAALEVFVEIGRVDAELVAHTDSGELAGRDRAVDRVRVDA